MAKRGRPSKKVIQKRKKVKSQSELYILFLIKLSPFYIFYYLL